MHFRDHVASKLVYFELEKELFNYSETVPRVRVMNDMYCSLDHTLIKKRFFGTYSGPLFHHPPCVTIVSKYCI